MEQKHFSHGFVLFGNFDRLVERQVNMKDGGTFTVWELHVLVNGLKQTVIYHVNTKHPEKFKGLKVGDHITIPVYVTARAANGRAYLSYYEVA